MNSSLSFVMKQAGSINKSYSEPLGESRTDEISILDIISRVRILVKKIERANST